LTDTFGQICGDVSRVIVAAVPRRQPPIVVCAGAQRWADFCSFVTTGAQRGAIVVTSVKALRCGAQIVVCVGRPRVTPYEHVDAVWLTGRLAHGMVPHDFRRQNGCTHSQVEIQTLPNKVIIIEFR